MMDDRKIAINDKNISAFEKDPQQLIENFAEWFKE